MTVTIVTLGIALALGGTGQNPSPTRCNQAGHHHHHGRAHGGFILPDGPGDGYGFPNGNPDGYGYVDYGYYLPLGSNRTGEYFFQRYVSVPPEQMFMGTYYNPYVNRGQRYIPFAGNGGEHPAGGPPLDTAQTPVKPYTEMAKAPVSVRIPRLNGRVEAPPVPSGATGLTP